MNNEKISRRSFIRNTSLIAAGIFVGKGCTVIGGTRYGASKIDCYNPKRDGGCAVSLGYDVDMPPGGDIYLYDRSIGWLYTDEEIAHGHLNDDIRNYINTLGTIAESYDSQLHFFIQGNTFEREVDTAFWKEFAKRGHAIDSHMYYHDELIEMPVDEVKSQLTRTKKLIEGKLGTKNIGLRGPGGYDNALRGREDVQRAVLDVGIKWVSTQFQYPDSDSGNDKNWINMIPKQQPFFY